MLINGCDNHSLARAGDDDSHIATVDIPLPAALSTATTVVATAYRYRDWMGQGPVPAANVASLAECPPSVPLWQCGPATPEVVRNTTTVPPPGASVPVEVPALSVVFVRIAAA
jgi:hypothetical protein